MNLQDIKKFLKDNSLLITSVGAVLVILNQFGFNINVPQLYNSLDVKSQIAFVGVLNLLITILVLVYLSNKINKKESK